MSMVMAGGIGRVPGICGTLATFAAIGALLGAADGAVPTGGAIRSPVLSVFGSGSPSVLQCTQPSKHFSRRSAIALKAAKASGPDNGGKMNMSSVGPSSTGGGIS